MSGLSRFGLFDDGISRWFAADSKCGAADGLLTPGPTNIKNDAPLKMHPLHRIPNGNVAIICEKKLPPPTEALGWSTFCAGGAALTVSLRFCFEFDVAIDCCGNFSEAEIYGNSLLVVSHWDNTTKNKTFDWILIYC